MTRPDDTTTSELEELLTAAALAGDWNLDPSRSSVSLSNKSIWGLVRVTGVFREIAGQGTVTPAGRVTGTMTVTSASVDTQNAKRDAHLRSADFFDSDHYPQITFAVDSILSSGLGVTVTGTLAVRGRGRPLAFDGTAVVRGDDGEVWIDAKVQLNRTDFGLTWNLLGLVSPTTTVSIHAVFTGE
jgi:polyisoprenoid-binding protein YceI